MTGMRPESCDRLITASVICNGKGGVIEDGAVAVTGSQISAIGSREIIERNCVAEDVYHLGNAILFPGFANCHTHASMTLLRGFAEDLPLKRWLEERIWPAEERLDPELIEAGALLGAAEMALAGISVFSDMYMHEDRVAGAAVETGLRVVAGESFFAFPSPFFPTADECWDAIRALEDRYRGEPLVSVSVSPHSIYTVGPDYLEQSYALAEELDCLWQTHCAENPQETGLCLERYGKRPIQILSHLGLLSPRTVLHHCVDVDERDLELLADSATWVVHCPSSNLKLGSGIAPVASMLERGINVCAGTDGASSNNSLDMAAELRLASLLQKGSTGKPEVLDALGTLSMGWMSGRRALGLDGGSLAEGAPADMAAYSLDRAQTAPVHDPHALLAYSCQGRRVDFHMVAGAPVVLDGKLVNVDEELVAREAARAARLLTRPGG